MSERVEIEKFDHFEIVVKRALQDDLRNEEAQAPIYALLLNVFKAGFECGKNGKAYVEL
jgi:hypothetical protein